MVVFMNCLCRNMLHKQPKGDGLHFKHHQASNSLDQRGHFNTFVNLNQQHPFSNATPYVGPSTFFIASCLPDSGAGGGMHHEHGRSWTIKTSVRSLWKRPYLKRSLLKEIVCFMICVGRFLFVVFFFGIHQCMMKIVMNAGEDIAMQLHFFDLLCVMMRCCI